MLAVRARLPAGPTARPPVVLVHGAANSAVVWTYWQEVLADHGWPSYALDLRGHGASPAADLARTSMADYADDVVTVARDLSEPPVLIGWSMGGLVAMLAAARVRAPAVVGSAPSAPARQRDAGAPLRRGTFGAEAYGITSRDVEHQPAMEDLDREERRLALDSLGPESQLARDERAAGIVVPALPCPLLIVTGSADRQWPRGRYADLLLPAEFLEVEGASHWGLVLSRKALPGLVPAVLEWLASRATLG